MKKIALFSVLLTTMYTVSLPSYSCAISSIYYHKIMPDDWDARPLRAALLKDHNVHTWHHTDELKFKIDRTHRIRDNVYSADGLNWPMQKASYSYPKKDKQLIPQKMTVYLEVLDRKKDDDKKDNTEFALKTRLLALHQNIKLLRFQNPKSIYLHGYAPSYRVVFLFHYYNRNRKEPETHAYVSPFFVVQMPHCGGIFPVLPADFDRLCADSDDNNGTQCYVY